MSYDKKINQDSDLGNIKMSDKFGFSHLLYYLFIVEKKFRVDEISERMGIHKDTLYKMINGTNPFSPDYINPLLKATESLEIIQYLINGTDFRIINVSKKESELLYKFGKALIQFSNEEKE